MGIKEDIDIYKKVKEVFPISEVSCKPLDEQGTIFECVARIPNKDNRTYLEGKVHIRFLKDNTGIKMIIVPVEHTKNNIIAHFVIKEYFKKLYSDTNIDVQE